jgi:type VI secretion system protein ImpL
MLIALIIFLLVSFAMATIWVGGWFFAWALTLKIALSIVTIAFVIMGLLVSFLLRLRRAARLEQDLLAQSMKQAESAKPDRRKEILALQQQASKAIGALKGSRLAKGGHAALYALPWYVIVGPPGAGKTTAIRHSGLDFPIEQAGSAFRGTGGTRNCDWWFTNEAILLDTAGRYSTETDDQQEWFAFLDLLKRNRPRKPINGLLVALSVTDLIGASDEQIGGIAKRLRARVDEVTTRLRMRVPVYVLLTKTDMIAGFTEFWNDLRKSDRGQLWGMSFPLAPTTEEPGAIFEREFDLLLKSLQARTVRRLTSERHVETRRLLWMFPVEFAPLRANLSSFIGQLFQRNSFQETPAFRGVYFTSGTQNTRPMSRVLQSMASSFGMRLPGPIGAAIEAKSFFLTDVFRRVIFPDQLLAGQTESEKRRRLLVRLAVAAVCLFMGGCLDLPGVLTFSHNKQLLHATADTASGIESAKWAETGTLDANAPKLDAAQEQLRQLAEWNDNGAPVQMRWGMYEGRELYVGLRDVYVTAVSRAVMDRAFSDLDDRLHAMDTGPMRTSENFNRDFDTLKLYLMLGDPSKMDPTWAARRLVQGWHLTSHARVKDEERLVLPHVEYVLELLAKGEVKPWKSDPALVTRARSILSQVPQVERLYESLVRDANVEIAPIRRETIFYGAVAPFVQSRKQVKVDGAYTKLGWGRVRALLGEQRAKLAAEQWVLGDGDDTSAQGAVDKLRGLYFERYKTAWRDFFVDLQVQDPGNADLAIEELQALSEPEWAYLRLIRTLNDNAVLEMDDPEADKGMVDRAIDKAKELLDGGALITKKRVPSPVERAFKPILKFGVPPDVDNPTPTGLSQYEALLAKLVGALSDLKEADSNTDPRKTSDVFQEAFRSTSALLSEQDGFTRPLLSPLLMNPINLAWGNVVQDAGRSVGAVWEASVWQKWHDKLEGKYPFANSPSDAALEDFVDFFAPGDGTLWSFYDESLKATLDRSGSSFVPSRRFKSSISYSGDFLGVCLKRGDEFKTTLFPPKTDHAAVVFDVNIHSVSPTIGQVTFEVDGASHTYRNEPEQWLTVTWPGKTPHGARLRVRGSGGLDEEVSRPGDFGLFRLIDNATIKPGRAGGRADGVPTLVATWDLRAARDGASVSLDLRPVRDENPLAPGYFKNYNCPRLITSK